MMTRELTLRCACGAVEGRAEAPSPAAGRRVVCYCGSCQAFAEVLGQEDRVLDAHGGTEIFQTAAGRIAFTRGAEHLACLRLTPKGPLRWYAACCNTPVGNTGSTAALPFIGLIHAIQSDAVDGTPRETLLGPVRTRVHVGSGHAAPGGEPVPEASGLPGAVAGVLRVIAKARLTGRYRDGPFFTKGTGAPIVPPREVTRGERIAPLGAAAPASTRSR